MVYVFIEPVDPASILQEQVNGIISRIFVGWIEVLKVEVFGRIIVELNIIVEKANFVVIDPVVVYDTTI